MPVLCIIMKKSAWSILAGITILFILALSYFIEIQTVESYNYAVNLELSTPLLGIIIFHSPLVLAFYIILAIILIFAGVFPNGRKK